MKTPGLVRHGLALLALALAACGGGGGGSSTGSGSPTSLVPPAPGAGAGAVLYSDAGVLRPLRAQAEWTYHGRDRSGGTSTRYRSSVRHDSAATGVIEQSTGVLNDTWYPETVSNSNGTILETQTIDFLGEGAIEKFTVTELRSPVRQADQYTLYERSFARSGFDVDADRIEDGVDVAAYRSVVGNEDVQLADQSTVRALRVDMTGLVRFRRSSDGTYTATQKIVQSNWYASGIGIVRRSLKTPDGVGDNAVDLDEVLVNWDGVVEGRGHTTPLRAVVPGSTQGNLGLGLGLVPALGAAGLDDAALIVSRSSSPAASESGGIVVSALDRRGAVTASHEHPGLLRPAGLTENDSFAAFARLGNGAALLTTPSTSATENRLFVFDADGQLVNGRAGVLLPLGSARGFVEMAWDGSKLWVQWFKVSYNPSTRYDLVLRAFDAQGNPLTPEHVLEPGVDSSQVTDAHLSADAAGQVVATWASTGFYERALRYAVVTPAAGTPVVKTFVATGSAQQLNLADKTLRPVAGVGAAALVWSGPIMTGNDPLTGPSTDHSVRGVRLDSSFSVTRSTAGAINTELLGVTSSPTHADFRAASLGGALVVSNARLYGKFYADDPAETSFNEIAQFPVSTSALASTTPVLTRIVQGEAAGADLGAVQHIIALSDRILLIGGIGTVVTSVVWRR